MVKTDDGSQETTTVGVDATTITRGSTSVSQQQTSSDAVTIDGNVLSIEVAIEQSLVEPSIVLCSEVIIDT